MSRRHSSLLVRFLRDPLRELAHGLAGVEQALVHLLPVALGLAAAAVVLLVVRALFLRLREQRLAGGARLLELAVPPELEPEGALLLWSSLHDLLRPQLARLFAGQPQLAWEITADEGGSRFRIWIPATVPPGLVERALASAWPGITTHEATTHDDDAAAATAEKAA
ncbi:MAG: hypothetical protein KGL16_10260 [Acidobacteriota bacterium]|nr:hypothetical protein [Acidobacteriota bacterium]